LHFLGKYKDFREGVLANANAGGENVHRGLVLGALLGAQAGAKQIPAELKSGLKHSPALEQEINAFVAKYIPEAAAACAGGAGGAGAAADRVCHL